MDKETLIRTWALNQVGSPYVYGGTGQRCTPDYRRARMAQYPEYAPLISGTCQALKDGKGCAGCGYQGKACFDCAQLTRRAMEAVGIGLPSGASSQWLNGPWAYKGPLDGTEQKKVCVLFRAGGSDARPMKHAGLSLGDGRAVDARGHRQGVMLTALKDYPWTHYAVPAGLAEEPVDIKYMQTLLMASGFGLPRYGADGKYGEETRAALVKFQRAMGLEANGVADGRTLAMLEKEAAEPPGDVIQDIEKRLQAVEAALRRLEGGRV